MNGLKGDEKASLQCIYVELYLEAYLLYVWPPSLGMISFGLVVTMPSCQAHVNSSEAPLDSNKQVGLVAL